MKMSHFPELYTDYLLKEVGVNYLSIVEAVEDEFYIQKFPK